MKTNIEGALTDLKAKCDQAKDMTTEIPVQKIFLKFMLAEIKELHEKIPKLLEKRNDITKMNEKLDRIIERIK